MNQTKGKLEDARSAPIKQRSPKGPRVAALAARCSLPPPSQIVLARPAPTNSSLPYLLTCPLSQSLSSSSLSQSCADSFCCNIRHPLTTRLTGRNKKREEGLLVVMLLLVVLVLLEYFLPPGAPCTFRPRLHKVAVRICTPVKPLVHTPLGFAPAEIEIVEPSPPINGMYIYALDEMADPIVSY